MWEILCYNLCYYARNLLRTLILFIQTLALYKSFTYLLTYFWKCRPEMNPPFQISKYATAGYPLQ